MIQSLSTCCITTTLRYVLATNLLCSARKYYCAKNSYPSIFKGQEFFLTSSSGRKQLKYFDKTRKNIEYNVVRVNVIHKKQIIQLFDSNHSIIEVSKIIISAKQGSG